MPDFSNWNFEKEPAQDRKHRKSDPVWFCLLNRPLPLLSPLYGSLAFVLSLSTFGSKYSSVVAQCECAMSSCYADNNCAQGSVIIMEINHRVGSCIGLVRESKRMVFFC